MNWKEHANLFANGRFKAGSGGVTFNIIGYHVSCGFWFISKHAGDFQVADCTLIARPISDMTDEERNEVYQTLPDAGQTWREHRENYEEYVRSVAPGDIAGGVDMSSEIDELTDLVTSYTPATLKALSFGVYTGPQSHFDTGEVLNINEV